MISTSKAVSCEDCQRWVHVKCTKTISVDQCTRIHCSSVPINHLWVQKNSEFSYMCDNCTIKNLPFNSEDFDTDNQNIRLDNPLSTHPDYYSKFKNKGLHFIHCNARSLLPKISEVRIIALKTKAAVISITVGMSHDAILISDFKNIKIKSHFQMSVSLKFEKSR